MRCVSRCCSSAVKTVACALIYAPFLGALLVESVRRGRAVEPRDWKEEIGAGAWLISTAGFAGQVAYLFLRARYDDVPLLPLVLWMSLQNLAVVYYAYNRAELRVLPPQRKFRFRNPANYPVLAGLLFESCQILAASARPFFTYVRMSPQPYDERWDDLFLASDLFIPTWRDSNVNFGQLYIGLAIMSIYSLLVGFWIAMERDDTPGYLFDILPGALYLTVVTPVLLADEAGCLHFGTDVAKLFVWLLYASSAVFVSMYRSDYARVASDIVYAPFFACTVRAVKTVFVVVLIYGKFWLETSAFLTLLIEVFIAVFLYVFRPCSSKAVARLMLLFFALAAWTSASSLAMLKLRVSSLWRWIGCVLAGWTVLLLFGLGLCARRWRARRLPAHSVAELSAGTSSSTELHEGD